MIAPFTADPVWKVDPDAALAEVERRIRKTGRTTLATGHFKTLIRPRLACWSGAGSHWQASSGKVRCGERGLAGWAICPSPYSPRGNRLDSSSALRSMWLRM
jgi:hypothetical protein